MAFFDPLPSKTKTVRKNSAPSCASCELSEGCITPRMPAHGYGDKGILIIGEAPGAAEDREGQPMVGQAGQLLTRIMEERYGIDLDYDCRKINAVACKPGKGVPVSDFHISCCRKRVLQEIQELQPKLILCLGPSAVRSVIGNIMPGGIGGIERWRGFTIPDQTYQAWVCPVWHPGMLLHEEKRKTLIERIFYADLDRAISTLSTPLPLLGDLPGRIHILTDPDAVEAHLRRILRELPPLLSFDYETKSLKPQRTGAGVHYVGLAESIDEALAFPLFPQIVPAYRRVMKEGRIRKVAHNLKFEDSHTAVSIGVEVQGWAWDSMIGGHVCDNRRGINDLEFQAYVRLGVPPWSGEVYDYLKPSKDEEKRWGGNAFNQVHVPSVKKILTYVGIDALTGYAVALHQMNELESDMHLMRGYRLLHQGAQALARAERHGLLVDIPYCERAVRDIEAKESLLIEKLRREPEIKQWEKKYGPKFNLYSDTQLGWFLYTHLELEPTSYTDNGNPSVGGAAVEGFAAIYPFLKDLLQLGKYQKIRSTYLGGLLRETINGVCHPFFHLHTVQTYRSSSANPNWQNLPIRDKEMGALIRKAILARPGRVIVEIDYSGVEVRVACCYHKDSNMMKYIYDPSTDMHRDTAMKLFILNAMEWARIEGKWAKPIRQTSKNGYVFAEFYGDYYKNCAENIWNQMKLYDLRIDGETTLFDWLAEKGIETLEDFTEHVREVEDWFWGERFPEYDAWRDAHVEAYYERGHFDMFTGFRCSGLMSRNESINYPGQGAAFHCLLWSFIRLDRWIRVNNKSSRLVAQIHDSVIIDAAIEELTELMDAAQQIMCKDIVKDFPWLIVPLEIEADVTPIEASWHDKRAVERVPCQKCDNQWIWKEKKEGYQLLECPACGWKHSHSL